MLILLIVCIGLNLKRRVLQDLVSIMKIRSVPNIKLTLGSNLRDDAVKNAALPSFNTMANPPTKGEYSISTM